MQNGIPHRQLRDQQQCSSSLPSVAAVSP
uniref:Uncharacterized protein n=1 Tax=Arundo donax TaxID=35708 RepID=A0A0A9BN99_ARUDO